MIDVKYERGRTLTYPTMYPRLRITPVFAHRGDFTWIESIVCKYDSNIDDIEEPEFEFVRSTIHDERSDALKAENAKLRKLLHDARSELKKAEDELGRDLMNSATVLLGIRMHELGIEVEE